MLDSFDDLWLHIRRAIAIRLGNLEDAILTTALQKLRQSLPDAVITLMTSPSASQAGQLPWVDEVLVYEGTLFTSNARELALIETLSCHAFDAAFIFTNDQESPYPLAYICYLAGIPIRLGRSQEFGGSVLYPAIAPPLLRPK